MWGGIAASGERPSASSAMSRFIVYSKCGAAAVAALVSKLKAILFFVRSRAGASHAVSLSLV